MADLPSSSDQQPATSDQQPDEFRIPHSAFRIRAWSCLLASLCVVALSACSGGVYHVVKPGENLYRIGKAYGVPHQMLARHNRVRDPSRIYPGQKIHVPGARKRVPVDVVTPTDQPRGRRPSEPGPPPGKRPFTWPVQTGMLTSPYGPRGRSFHDGIDIAAPVGTPVYAAADGEVVYADVLRGYGRLIILRHPEGYATVYAHNRENRVREGQRVRRGELIAKVGESGRTTAPNLHFEVRRHNAARDPLLYLQPTEQVRIASGE